MNNEAGSRVSVELERNHGLAEDVDAVYVVFATFVGDRWLLLGCSVRAAISQLKRVAAGGRLALRVDPPAGPGGADWTYSIPVAGTTNRLTNPAGGQTVTYDAAGNLTSWNGQSYSYDPFGMAWQIVADLGSDNEGSVTFDGQKVFLNVDDTTGGEAASRTSRLAHEIEHGVQVDNGMLGFQRVGDSWTVRFTDIFDEVDAWHAQLRQASPLDTRSGTPLRRFANAQNKAKYLMRAGYDQYQGRPMKRVNAPRVAGFAPGSILHTSNWFYRIPR